MMTAMVPPRPPSRLERVPVQEVLFVDTDSGVVAQEVRGKVVRRGRMKEKEGFIS